LGKENINLEPTIDRNIVNLLDLIRRGYLSKGSDIRPMDLAEKSQFFALDSILEIATGAPMGDLKQDKDVNSYLKTTADALPMLIMIGSVPSVQVCILEPSLLFWMF
jgi:hypothetical protein